ncbi:MAG: hypothetical protein AAFP04_01110 [Myxococcota bacterium]
MEAVPLLLACLLFGSIDSETSAEPPSWTRVRVGVANTPEGRLVFAVGESRGVADVALARERASYAARERFSRILLDAAASRPAPNMSGRDSMFADMGRSEVQRSLQSATLTGVEVKATWTSPDRSRLLAIATLNEQLLRQALESLPLSPGDQVLASSKMDDIFADLERETELQADEIPNVAPKSFDTKSASGVPDWVNYGCGRYVDQHGEEYLYGVGMVSGVRNLAMATSAADNRARTEISKCISVHVTRTNDTVKVFSANTLWGVQIVEHYYAPDGTIYALARVPASHLPNPVEQNAIEEQRRREESERQRSDERREQQEAPNDGQIGGGGELDASPAQAKEPPRDEKQCGAARSGRGLRIALGVIGPESELLRSEVESELRSRGFRVVDPRRRQRRPDGQLVLKVNATPDRDVLRGCLLEVEYLEGSKTMNTGTYPCTLGADPGQPQNASVSDMQRYASLVRCSIADNLWLAAKKGRARRRGAR